MDELIDAADVATLATQNSISQLISFLNNKNSAIRYWGATGLLILGKDALNAKEELIKSLSDKSNNVRIVSAEALYNMGEKQLAITGLSEVLNSGDQFTCTHALNIIDCLNISDPKIIEATAAMVKNYKVLNRKNYDLRAARLLFEKWKVDPADFNIEFNW